MQSHIPQFRACRLLPRFFGVLVGLCASTALAEAALLDDFNVYEVGNGSAGQQLSDVTGGVWQQSPGYTANADIADQGGGNHYFAFGNSDFRGGYRDAGFLIEDATLGNLLYFQLRAAANSSVNASFGVTASTAPSWFDAYRAQVLLTGNSIGGYELQARNDAGFSVLQTGLASGMWYDITLDINTLTDTYDVYLDADNNPATLGTLVADDFGFRGQGGGTVAENLESLFAFGGGDNESGHVDNIYFTPGSGIAEPDPLVLTVHANGVVRIHNSSSSESKDFNYYEIRSANGSLNTAWTGIDGNAAPSEFTWEQGDAGVDQTLLVEASLLGMTTLGPEGGVSIGTAYLGGSSSENQDLKFYYGVVGGTTLFEGDVVYVAGTPGDFNNDGAVNLADYTIWRTNVGATEDGLVLGGNGNGGVVDSSDYQLWRTSFGNLAAGLTAAQASATVPEPESVAVATTALLTLWVRVGRVRTARYRRLEITW